MTRVLFVWLLAASAATAQTPQQFIASLYDQKTGAYKVSKDEKPGLRATSGAVRALQYLGEKDIPNKDKLKAYVLSCYDPTTGAFTDPSTGKADVATTSVGVMGCFALGIEKSKIAKSMDFLRVKAVENKNIDLAFEDVRIAAAAVELFKSDGSKDPFDLKPWIAIADQYAMRAKEFPNPSTGIGAVVAMKLRMGQTVDDAAEQTEFILNGQWRDGGWRKPKSIGSDLDSTYRVVRALKLLKAKPDADRIRTFLKSCRNADGGSSVLPGQPSTMSGTYYAAAIEMWMKELNK